VEATFPVKKKFRAAELKVELEKLGYEGYKMPEAAKEVFIKSTTHITKLR